ncbi:hypothetical protein AHAS_Ahas10G0090500 [Arachis hypogaea]
MAQTNTDPQSTQVLSHVSIEDVLKTDFFTPEEARESYMSYSRLKADGSRMYDLIWSDGRSQEDYEAFDDVLAFDATYRRNKYNLLVIVLSGINHRNQISVFAIAMMRITDFARDIYLGMPSIIAHNHVGDDVDLYRKKLSWATAYIRGKFFIGIRITSQCKSLHAKLGGFVESRYGILEFVTNFQRCVDFLRDKEEELDFWSFYGTPVLQTQFPEIEMSATTLYTHDIFYRF